MSHEEELKNLVVDARREQELHRGLSSDVRIVQREVSDLKAIAVENRNGIRGLAIALLVAVVTAYFSKYIK